MTSLPPTRICCPVGMWWLSRIVRMTISAFLEQPRCIAGWLPPYHIPHCYITPLPCPCPITAPNSPMLHHNPYSSNCPVIAPTMTMPHHTPPPPMPHHTRPSPMPHPAALHSVSHSEEEVPGGIPPSEITGPQLLAWTWFTSSLYCFPLRGHVTCSVITCYRLF